MRKANRFSDMAVEFCKSRKIRDDGVIKYYEVNVDKRMSAKLKRPVGKYSTIETSSVLEGREHDYKRVSAALSACLKEYAGGCKKIMAVGLGNPDLTADSLGDRVFKKLVITRHLNSDEYLCALTPNVLGMTGIESADIISAVVQKIKPDLVVAVDSLTAAATGRIASAFQVTDSGITPGSGVDNSRRRLDYSSLGVKVLSVGVPLVVYSSTISRESGGDRGDFDMVVTPKDVDVLVDDCAKIIADSVNTAFVSR